MEERLVGHGGPFELEFGPEGRVRFKAGPHTLTEILLLLARRTEREFLVTDRCRLTGAQFVDLALRGASALQRRNIGAGDRIALVGDDPFAWSVAMAAAVLKGACPLLLAERPFDGLVSDAGAGKLLSVDEFASEALALEPLALSQVHSPQAYDEVMVAFTSGTSGLPKGVVLDHGSVCAGLKNMILGAMLAALRSPRRASSSAYLPPCALVMAPLQHVAGYGQLLLMAVLGGRVILPSLWDSEVAGELIRTERVRSLVGLTPPMIEGLLSILDRDPSLGATLSSLTFYGEPLWTALARRLECLLPALEVGTGYGLTETNGSIAVASRDDLKIRPGTSGKLSPAVSVRLVDPQGEQVGPGEVGEILLSGPMIAAGYLGDTLGTFQNGWFRTGDFGRVDDDGFLFLDERDREFISSADGRISCVALENSALAHAGVIDAAAFGWDDGNSVRPVLAVVLKETTLDKRAVLPGNIMDDAMVRRGAKIVQVDGIPRTTSGKIDRKMLASAFADRLR